MTEKQCAERQGRTRRNMLKLLIGAFSGLVALTLGIPLIGAIIGPYFRTKKPLWIKVGDITSLPDGQPVNLKFPFKTEDAYLRETIIHDVWVVKHSS